MTDDPYAGMTPTQELVMEVLAARHRLGEKWWTFSSRPVITRAAGVLARAGLVVHMGVGPRTFRLRLTEAGVKACTDPTYTPPNAPLKCCCNHPEVGPTHACARCRIGLHKTCILNEDHHE